MSSSESDSDDIFTHQRILNLASIRKFVSSFKNQTQCWKSSQEENREVGAPYGDEPLASDEWIDNYQKEKEQKEINGKDLQNRLEKVIPTNGW